MEDAGWRSICGKRPPATFYSLMDSVEFANACMAPGYQCLWREKRCGGKCGIHAQLESIQQAVDRELQSHSLASILSGKLG